MLPERRPEEVLRLLDIVKRADLKVPADVEEFFIAYTKCIWDYKMVGLIYDHYTDETVIHGENGVDIAGIDAVVHHTLERLFTLPDMKINFIGIFADKISDDEFKFIQITYPEGTFTGPCQYGPATGEKLNYVNIMNTCECIVKKINGSWKIVEEWGLLGYKKFLSSGVSK
jgi:hypothetical protein